MTITFRPIPDHPRANIRIAQKLRQLVHDDLRASVKEEREGEREPVSEPPRYWWVS